jgi:hypothetical protein
MNSIENPAARNGGVLELDHAGKPIGSENKVGAGKSKSLRFTASASRG